MECIGACHTLFFREKIKKHVEIPKKLCYNA